MGDKSYTQRDFAALAGISTATVVKMVKSGELEKNAEGRISGSELQRVILSRIRKYADCGTLIITFGKSDEELDAMKENFLNSKYVKKDKDAIQYYDSINSIVNAVTKPPVSDISLELMQERYNREILTAFATKYKSVIDSYFASLACTRRFECFSRLETSMAYDYLLYGRFLESHAYNKESADAFLNSSDCIKDVIQREADAKFDTVMREFNLVGDNNQPLFRRTDLSEEFFKKSGELYNSFFYDSNGNRKVLFIKQCPKIAKNLAAFVTGKHTKSNIDRILSDGFYTIINMNSPADYEMVLTTAFSHVYSRIIIANTPEDLSQDDANRLGVLAIALNSDTTLNIVYDELRG